MFLSCGLVYTVSDLCFYTGCSSLFWLCWLGVSIYYAYCWQH